MPKLSGYQRFQLTLIWAKNGRQGDKELFIRRVCNEKGLEYVKPIKVERKI